eukprot:m.37453 g.37453  ORF g.37453 m.37453 type:complete len:801 (+) comp6733_c0_seq1:57-2459(+)
MFASLKSFLTTGVGDPSFPFAVGELKVARNSASIWNIRSGKSKPENKDVTIFELVKKDSSEQEILAAQHAVKKLRTMRHPSVVTFLGTTENDNVIYLATEEVTPLLEFLHEDVEKNPLGLSWGLYQVLSALSFFAESKLVHRSLCINSIFVCADGDWKLFGFERLGPFGTSLSDLPLPVLPQYACPEDENQREARKAQPWSADMWGYGILLWEVYNTSPLIDVAKLKDVNDIPKHLVQDYISAMSANPRSRPKPSNLLEEMRGKGRFFSNEFVHACIFLGELAVKDEVEVTEFYTSLPTKIDRFPKTPCRKKILPQLLNAFHFGGAGYQVLGPILKIGAFLDAEEYNASIVPSLIDLFSSKDRATRIALLQKLGSFIEYLSTEVITKDVFPHVANGFSDTNNTVREETVKSMLLLAPKLSSSVVNGPLMKHFSRLLVDEKPSIRTNTTICLGKIAPNLNPATRIRVLVPSFLKALKDRFMHTRSAGLMGINATIQEYDPMLLAARILPEIVPLTTDPVMKVRTQALSLLRVALDVLDKNSIIMEENMKKEQEQKAKEEEAKRKFEEKMQGVENAATKLVSWGSSLTRGGSENATKADGDDTERKGNSSSEKTKNVKMKLKGVTKPIAFTTEKIAEDDDDEFHDCKETYHDNENSDWEDDGWENMEGDDDDDGPDEIDIVAPEKHNTLSLNLKVDGDDWGDDGWGEEDDNDAEELHDPVVKTPKPPKSYISKSKEDRQRERERRLKEREQRIKSQPSSATAGEVPKALSSSTTTKKAESKKKGMKLTSSKKKGLGLEMKKD